MTPSEQQIKEALEAFIITKTWERRARLVRDRNDVFLSDAMDVFLESLIESAAGNEDFVASFTEIRQLLARCRQDGIEVAFTDLLSQDSIADKIRAAVIDFINASEDEVDVVAQRYVDLLRDPLVDSVFASLFEQYNDQPDTARQIAERHELLILCRELGITAALQNWPHFREQTIDAATAFVTANGLSTDAPTAWSEARQLVEEHGRFLLTDYGESLVALWVALKTEQMEKDRTSEASRNQILAGATEKLHLLRRCREVGIDQAFTEKHGMLFDDYIMRLISFSSLAERTNDWALMKLRLVQDFPELLSQEAYWAMEASGLWSGRFDTEFPLRTLFTRLQTQTIDEACADLVEFGMVVPLSLRDRLRRAQSAGQRYRQTRDRITLDEALREWESIIDDDDLEDAPLSTQRTLLIEAGDTYEARFREREEAYDLRKAIELWQRAVTKMPAGSIGAEFPEFLNYLGHSLEVLHDHTNDQTEALSYLRNAIDQYQQAYEAGEDELSGAPPAPPQERGSRPTAFEEYLYHRRQRAKYLENQARGYTKLYEHSRRIADLDQAIDLYKQAIAEAEKNDLRPVFLFSDLGRALLTRFEVTHKEVDAAAATEAFEQALRLCTPETSWVFRFEIGYFYGSMLYDAAEFATARPILEVAHNALGDMRREEQFERRRRAYSIGAGQLYARLVTCCLRLDDVPAAFEYAAAAKGRTFVDMLAETRFNLVEVGPDRPELYNDLQPYLAIRTRIDDLLADLTAERRPRLGDEDPAATQGANESELRAELENLLRKQNNLWDDLTSRYTFLAAIANVPPLSLEDTHYLAHRLDATLVEYYRHDRGWSAFVVTAGSFQHVALPLLTDDLLRRLVLWVSSLEPSVARYGASDNRLLSEWYAAVVAPLAEYLPLSDQPLFFAPFGPLHLLPFTVARDPRTGHFAIDDYNLVLVPSLSTLAVVAQQADKARPDALRNGYKGLLAVAYPGAPGSRRYLSNVLDEARTVATYFRPVTTLIQEGATPTAVIIHSHNQDVVHLGCHAYFLRDFPTRSGLALAGGWLTVNRIITEMRLQDTSLVTMAACESGRVDLNTGDELIGLTQAMLVAGAKAVVASLWVVNDASTRALFEAFYAQIARGRPPSLAMREATQVVRTQVDWSHPYHWAAFGVFGLGHLPIR